MMKVSIPPARGPKSLVKSNIEGIIKFY